MKVCTNCGGRNDDDAAFCAACNFFLDWSNDQPDVAVVRLPQQPSPATTETLPAPPRASLPAPERAPTTPGPPGAETDGEAPANDDPVDDRILQAAVVGLEQSKALAIARERPDLALTLDQRKAALDERSIGVAVIGEFKKGKSTLINALLQAAICPVDADEVTVVPTFVRYGPSPSAVAYLEPPATHTNEASQSFQPEPQPIPLEQLTSYVSETGNASNRRHLRSVEVRLPHKMLRKGLCLIDTPGVGGLDSAHGVITLGALDLASGMLFVTDASQELTEPELTFLSEAVLRCPDAACVVTKTDLHRQWRRIVTLNEQHLARAGLVIPVIPVSSFLRLASRKKPSLTNESGYPTLVDFLASVVTNADAVALAATADDVGFVAQQLRTQVGAESAVLTQPAHADRVITQLIKAQTGTAAAVSPTATWQQVLSDGIQDLTRAIEYDRRNRVRKIQTDIEEIIDTCDPADAWADIEVWLKRNVIATAVEHYDELARRTNQLAVDVSETFNLDVGGAIAVRGGSPTESLTMVNLASAKSLATPGGRFAPMLMATRTALFVPMVLFGVAGGLLGVVAAPLTAILAVGIGQKVIRDERKRQIAARRQQAKIAARRYIDEVSFRLSEESQDALVRAQRQLRDDFQNRAKILHRSNQAALQTAQRAITLTGSGRQQRVSQLAAETKQLDEVSGRIARLMTKLPSTAAG